MATKKRDYKVKGVTMTAGEFNAFVNYLNHNRVQRYTKQDVSNFLESYHTVSAFRSRRAYDRKKR